MTEAASMVQIQAIQAFDSLAARYDDLFTHSMIGRAQRNAVWSILGEAFAPGSRILELNCGTGEDALFLDRHCISVVACDASQQMIQRARQRMLAEAPEADIRFEVLAIEHLAQLVPGKSFDGAFSNFSGLNCVANLAGVARDLASVVGPRAPVLLCLSTRFCMIETLWFLFQGRFRKAFRRTSGRATAHVGEFVVNVHYPALRKVRQWFAPHFRLLSCTGIGVTVPPSYLEPTLRKYPRLLRLLAIVDRRISRLPLLRTVGDHMLLHFERREGECS